MVLNMMKKEYVLFMLKVHLAVYSSLFTGIFYQNILLLGKITEHNIKVGTHQVTSCSDM